MRQVFDPDRLAGVFAQAARIGLESPPCWDGGKISIPVVIPSNGHCIGHVLPGRGFALAGDLRSLGIRRSIPGVFEHSPVWRLREKLERWGTREERMRLYSHRGVIRSAMDDGLMTIEMLSQSPELAAAKSLAAAITTYDGIIGARAGGKGNDWAISQASLTTVAQAFSSLFRAGGNPGVGTYTNIPGGAVQDRSNAGAMSLGLWNPSSSEKKYLLTFGYGSSSAIDWGILVDMLVACGNISASSTGSQTVNSTAQTRQYADTLGGGVMATFEVTTALGTGTGTATLTSYTDQSGNTGAASGTITSVASAIANRLIPSSGGAVPWVQLAAGDWGIRSVESFQYSAAHSAGVLALNLSWPLMYLPGLAANLYIERDTTAQIDGILELAKSSGDVIGCLTLYVQTNSTSSGTLKAFIRTAAG